MLLLSSVSETFFWGRETPPEKGRMPSQAPILFGKGKEPNTKKRGGGSSPPTSALLSSPPKQGFGLSDRYELEIGLF